MKKLIYLFLYVGFLWCGSLSAQDEQEGIQLDRSEWKKSAEKMDYTETFKEIKPKEGTSRNSNINWGVIGYVFIFIVLVALIALLLYWLSKSRFTFNEKLKPIDFDIDSEAFEKQIMELDLQQLLDRALQYEDYRSAIRLKYLQLIKTLNALQWIEWSVEKTNGQYLKELRQQLFFGTFKKVTYQYELAWYSNTPIEALHYQNFLKVYSALEPQIKRDE